MSRVADMVPSGGGLSGSGNANRRTNTPPPATNGTAVGGVYQRPSRVGTQRLSFNSGDDAPNVTDIRSPTAIQPQFATDTTTHPFQTTNGEGGEQPSSHGMSEGLDPGNKLQQQYVRRLQQTALYEGPTRKNGTANPQPPLLITSEPSPSHATKEDELEEETQPRHVSFAANQPPDSFKPPSKLTAYYRRTRHQCRLCCCPRRKQTLVEPIRYVTADGVEIMEEETEEEEDEYGYGAEESFYSYDNDPRERGASSTHRFFRREFAGVKLRHWVYITTFFLCGVGLASYLWLYFSSLATDLLRDRFSKFCTDRISMSSNSLLEVTHLINEAALLVESLQNSVMLADATAADTLNLQNHLSFHTFGTESPALYPFVGGLALAAIVTGDKRASFELIHGSTILNWNASSNTLTTAPVADLYIPVLLSSHLAPTVMVDLLTIPYWNSTILQMVKTARTQHTSPYYVSNYSAPAVGWDGGGTAGVAGKVLDGALTATSGYRTFSLTPIHHYPCSNSPACFNDLITINGEAQLNLTALSGITIASLEITNWIYSSQLYAGTDLDAVVEVFSDYRVNQPARIYNGFQTTSTPTYDSNYASRPLDATFFHEMGYSSSVYQDASESELHLDTSYAYSTLYSPSLLYTGLSWSATCTPTVGYVHRNLDWTQHVIGSLILGAVIIFSLFTITILRQMTAKEREVRFKNQVLTELQGEREKAEQAGNAKTDFMAFLCHELRNPLHAVLSMSDSLKDTTLDADQSESVFTIHASSELMLAITNDILDLSKIEAGRIELETIPVDVTALVQSLVRGNRSWAAEKGVTVVGIVDPKLSECNYVYADPTRLNQMLTNLISNAIKFTTKNGHVTIQVTVAENSHVRHQRSPIDRRISPTQMEVAQLQTIGLDEDATTNKNEKDQQQLQEKEQNKETSLIPLPMGVTISNPLSPQLAPTGSDSSHSVPSQVITDQPLTPTLSNGGGPISTHASQSMPSTPGVRGLGSTPQISAIPRLNVKKPSVVTSKPIFLNPRASSIENRRTSATSSDGMPSATTATARVPSPPSTPPDAHHLPSFEQQIDMLQLGDLNHSVSGLQPASISPVPSHRGSIPLYTRTDDNTSSPLLTSFSPNNSGTGSSVLPFLHANPNLSRHGSTRTIATFPVATNSPLIGGINVVGVNDRSHRTTKEKRLAGTSPASTPLFGSQSPLAHAPAALQATLPLLLLNRHKRVDSSNSPRLFGPHPAPHIEVYSGHPLSQSSHANVSVSPPGKSRSLGPRNHSLIGSSTTPPMGINVNDLPPIPHSVTNTPPLPGQLTSHSSSSSHSNSNPQSNGGAITISPPTTTNVQPQHGRPSLSMSRNGVVSDKGRNLLAPPATGPTTSTAAGALAEEAEEFSRTHGQLGHVKLTFTVQDTGIGIPPEYMDALFEPYSQAKRSITRSHGGTGLGLAIVKRLGDLMNGQISVESEIGVGTAFSFTADFLIAKVPTPAMASMLRHQQPPDLDIGQVRYSNYTSLKINEPETNTNVNPPIIHMEPSSQAGAVPPSLTLPLSLSSDPNGPGAQEALRPLPSLSIHGNMDSQPSPSPERSPNHSPTFIASVAKSNQLKLPSMETLEDFAQQDFLNNNNNDQTGPIVHIHPIPPSTDGPLADLSSTQLPRPSSTTITTSPTPVLPHLSIFSNSPSVNTPDIVSLNGVGIFRRNSDDPSPSPHNGGHSPTGDDLELPLSPLGPRKNSSPKLPEGLSASSSTSPSPPPTGIPKPYILVVDDAAINRKILLKMLGNDYNIDQAENGLQAVELVDANPGKYCVVLMDLMMPVMGGTEAMQQIRSRGHTTLPVIAVTANTMNEDIDKCLSIGFTSFLSKPCRKELVRSMVKQYVGNPIAQNLPSPSRIQRRMILPSPVLGSANGQIVASLSPLPPGVTSMPSEGIQRRPSIMSGKGGIPGMSATLQSSGSQTNLNTQQSRPPTPGSSTTTTITGVTTLILPPSQPLSSQNSSSSSPTHASRINLSERETSSPERRQITITNGSSNVIANVNGGVFTESLAAAKAAQTITISRQVSTPAN